MGGNAIENARRIPRSEYFEIVDELQGIFPELKMKAVRAFSQKKDFGDIDIIVQTDPTINIKALIRERLKPEKEFDNNMFFSFGYKEAQVDFISMSPSDFVTAFSYFCWNDLGNFIGRTARSINFKYGHEGLIYELRLGDHYKKSIVVSKDVRKILNFLGYDSVRWDKGFETEQDIFEYAASSSLFNPAYFTLEDQSHNDRVRNKKRKMYQKMLGYINENGLVDRPKLSKEERQTHYDRAIKIFGDQFHKEVQWATNKFEDDLEFKKYYNGDFVSEITGFTGKQLGAFMSAFKNSLDWDTFYYHVLNEKEEAGEEGAKEFVLVELLSFYETNSIEGDQLDPLMVTKDNLLLGPHWRKPWASYYKINGKIYSTSMLTSDKTQIIMELKYNA